MMKQWSNWSGSLKFTPSALFYPETEEQAAEIIRNSASENRHVRVCGAGHSSSPLVVTTDVMVSLRHFRKIEKADKENLTAWVGTGLTVKEAGTELLQHGMSLHNTGDVDVQFLAGAISTGTHGTGIKLKSLSSMLTGCRMICSDGSIKEFTEEKDGRDFFDAMRVSLGTLGIMTSMKLKLLPSFRLERTEWCSHADRCLSKLDELIISNRNFDFYWYPRNDLVKLRILNEPGKGTREINYAERVEQITGEAIEVLPKERNLKFDEMEYAFPKEAGPSCFTEIRKIIKERFRKNVAWRVLYRTIAADDFHLSPYFGRDSATISLHHNAGLPYHEYFNALEPVFRAHGGRPHWGKKHNMRYGELSSLYSRWSDFLGIRSKMDPDGIFLNDYLKNQIFGI